MNQVHAQTHGNSRAATADRHKDQPSSFGMGTPKLSQTGLSPNSTALTARHTAASTTLGVATPNTARRGRCRGTASMMGRSYIVNGSSWVIRSHNEC